MKPFRTLSLSFALLLGAAPVGARPPAAPPLAVPDLATAPPSEIRGVLKELEGRKRLPLSGLSLVEVKDRLVLVSDTGRFAVVGDFRLLDLWSGADIKTLADADKIDRLDLKRIGIKPADLTQFEYGQGKHHVTVFVDPWCAHCHDLIGQMAPLLDQYTFHLVAVPVLGDKSVPAAKQLACEPDKAKALRALLDQNYGGLPAPATLGGCDLGTLQKTLITARLLGIDGVPYLILPSTRTRRGGTRHLLELLENDLATLSANP
jgi:thiol:disulfide interchange protein DsbC